MKKFFKVNALLLSLVLAGCSQMDGKRETGNYSVEGTILDKSGKAVSGVQVAISGSGHTASSNADGQYRITGVGNGTYRISAKKSGFKLVPDYASSGEGAEGAFINIGQTAVNGVVKNADFVAVEADAISISDIQGKGSTSPLSGEPVTVTGVVTLICHKAPNWNYDTTSIDGSNVAQYTSEDGFYLEALPEDKDYSGKKSNGIFIDTHDSAFEESSWKNGIPTDLQAGDVVTVSGIVAETRKKDRFGSSSGSLTRTCIKADSVYHKTLAGINVTAGYPDGVLLTYSASKAADWISSHSFTDSKGRTFKGEARVLAFDSNSLTPMQDAIDVLETVENAVIVIDTPRVVGAAYYNLTSVLADDGKDENGNHFRTFNEFWQGDVIQMNDETNVQDFNEEILFVDYQATDYKAYACNLVQIGDTIIDGSGDKIFRGVMDYTGDGLYMAHPLNTLKGYYLTDANAVGYISPYYTNSEGNDGFKMTSVSGKQIPNQLWKYSSDGAWYTDYADLSNLMKNQTSSNSNAAVAHRSGTKSSSSFNALSIFTPAWKDKVSTSTGYLDSDTLTVGAFNFENYDGQGSSNSKQENIALAIKNNMLYPDVVCVVEMGDDVDSEEVYTNQDNAWSYKDGCVTAVRNYSGIIDVIKKSQNGPQYDFRQIDPKEKDSGGEAGVNIRVGLMFNTERVRFVDTGVATNHYSNTHDADGNFLDESKWPVSTGNKDLNADNVYSNSNVADLADIAAGVYLGNDGKVHLSQSPCYIQDSSFKNSRRPLVGEFESKETGENFFVIACHLSSKRADYPLYGQLQPPLLLSEAGRNRQAQAVNEFVKKILSFDKNAKVIVAGDMNDFAYSTPLRVLTGQQSLYSDQILWSPEEEFMPKKEQFSYAFQGNLQEIDHIFVTKALFVKAQEAYAANDLNHSERWQNICFIPHIDSMFTRNNHYNLSDHDPAVLRIPGVFRR